MTELIEIGDCIESGRYRLHSRFRHALVFTREENETGKSAPADLACVVEEGLAGPTNIVVRGLDPGGADFLDVSQQRLLLGGVNLPIRQRYHSSPHIGPLDVVRQAANLRAFEDALRASAPAASVVFLLGNDNPDGAFDRELALRFRSAMERLTAGDLEGATTMLRGLGRGLTPSGDDFLAGFLLGLHGLQQATCTDLGEERRRIHCSAITMNEFSAGLLRHAYQGRCHAPAKFLLETLFDGPTDRIAVATRRLAAVGASSGADLGVGIAWAIRLYLNKAGKPC